MDRAERGEGRGEGGEDSARCCGLGTIETMGGWGGGVGGEGEEWGAELLHCRRKGEQRWGRGKGEGEGGGGWLSCGGQSDTIVSY